MKNKMLDLFSSEAVEFAFENPINALEKAELERFNWYVGQLLKETKLRFADLPTALKKDIWFNRAQIKLFELEEEQLRLEMVSVDHTVGKMVKNIGRVF